MGEVPGVDFAVPNVDLVHAFHLGDLCSRWGVRKGGLVRARGATGKGQPA